MKTAGNFKIYTHPNQFVSGQQVAIAYPHNPNHLWYYFMGHASDFYVYRQEATGSFIELDAVYVYKHLI
jgi:uncharacterized protein (DUF2249 family)